MRVHDGFRRLIVVVGAVAVVAAFVLIAPLKTLAFGFIEIFEPRTIALVPLTDADLRSLATMPDLGKYGEGRRLVDSRDLSAPDARSASQLARFAVREPVSPLLGNRTAGPFTVMGPTVSRFTFDATKVRAAALVTGAPLPAMPRGFDGSTLEFDTAPAVIATYLARDATLSTEPYRVRAWRSAHVRGHGPVRSALSGSLDGVVVAQMPIPRVSSTGVSAAEIEHFMLAQPGISPRLAAAFEALGDPRTTLPIPIPIDQSRAEPVAVDGVMGLGVGDQTGLGAVLIWQRGGMLYAVAGAMKASDLLAVANSLR
jgi:hypothetical protein